MKKIHKKRVPEMRAEYDFSRGVRGKYAQRFAQGSTVTVLKDNAPEAFPRAQAVNDARRALASIIPRKQKVNSGK
jgi:hypothetical protein